MLSLHQVNELAEIACEIESFTKAGRRVPLAVWEQYDRLNRRHKKHEHMMAVTAEMRKNAPASGGCKNNSSRSNRRRNHCGAGNMIVSGEDHHQDQEDILTVAIERRKEASGVARHPESNNSCNDGSGRFSSATFVSSWQGGAGCTFGSGRRDTVTSKTNEEGSAMAEYVPMPSADIKTPGRSQATWSAYELDKLNELCKSPLFVGS